jgi:hypothetical protein
MHTDHAPQQAIVYYCGNRVLAHGPASAEDTFTVLAEEAESARREGIDYLLELVAKKGNRVQPQLLRKLADLLDNGVESCRTTKEGFLLRAVGGRHGLPIAHPSFLPA